MRSALARVEAISASRKRAVKAHPAPARAGTAPELAAGLVEELGRILGEALIAEHEQVTGAMGVSPGGRDHPGDDDGEDGQ